MYLLMILKYVNSKKKDSEINSYPLCLDHVLLCFGNISNDLSVDKLKKNGLCDYVYDFSVGYDSLMLLISWIFKNI